MLNKMTLIGYIYFTAMRRSGHVAKITRSLAKLQDGPSADLTVKTTRSEYSDLPSSRSPADAGGCAYRFDTVADLFTDL